MKKRLLSVVLTLALGFTSAGILSAKDVNAKNYSDCYYRGKTQYCTYNYTKKNTKSDWKKKRTTLYRSKKFKKSNVKVRKYEYRNSKLTRTSTKIYYYNKKGKLRSNKYGKAKRIQYTYYSNSKVKAKRTCTYKSNGKLKCGAWNTKSYLKNKPYVAPSKPSTPNPTPSGSYKDYKFKYNGTTYTATSQETNYKNGGGTYKSYVFKISNKTLDIPESWFLDGKVFDNVMTKEKIEKVAEKETIRLLNVERAKQKTNGNSYLPQLKANTNLDKTTDIRSKELEQNYGDGHTRPNGTPYSTLLDQYGMKNSSGENSLWTNLNLGDNNPKEIGIVMYWQWYNSQLHKQNMLAHTHDDIGVGININLLTNKGYGSMHLYDSNPSNNMYYSCIKNGFGDANSCKTN